MTQLHFRWLAGIFIISILLFTANWWYRLPRFDAGEKAHDFSATLADGTSFQLSSLKGQYVLLDFWGSWCGPCRAENPALVALYRETRDDLYEEAAGFEMVSVAIETDEGRWSRAVRQDSLYWKYQIAEFDRFSSPIASLYGVREIPTKYLISPDGMILRVNPSIPEIQDFLHSVRKPE